MEIRETITIEGQPFPNPLPAPVELLQKTLAQEGLHFESLEGDRIVILHIKYDPSRLDRVKELVAEKGWDVKVSRSVWPVFEEDDYRIAPFCTADFPDIWIDQLDFSHKCPRCERKRFHVDRSARVTRVKSKKPLLCVNGQFKIVSADVASAFSQKLLGSRFSPFDEEGRYVYVGAATDIGPLIVHQEEVLDYVGCCPECGIPNFKNYFGPLRHAASNWNGDDIVFEPFYNDYLFTQRAFALLRTFDKKLDRSVPAFLEA